MIKILGIESSCDETGVAICFDNQLQAHCLYSQIDLHKLYGGVVPELASRDHLRKIIPLIDQCLVQAKIFKSQLDAIAYTAGPGLNGALLVGASVANALGYALNKPVIPVHHLEGHLLSPLLSENKPPFPFLALLVSGGHTQIILVQTIAHYQLLGESLDDAAGEAFDKTAKMLGLPYPGGKHLAELATKGKDCYKLPRPMINSKNLTMSFSGLKTAVMILINNLQQQGVDLEQEKNNIAASIETAIIEVLVKKILLASELTGINNVVIAGGVSANQSLRAKLKSNKNIQLYVAPLEFCTDNGAMIALAGFYRYQQAKFNYSFSVFPRFELINA